MVKQKRSFLDKIVGSEKDNSVKNKEEIPVEHNVKVEHDIEEEQEEEREDVMPSAEEIWDQSGEEDGQLAVDVYQTEDSIVIKSIIGGVRPEDLELSITNDMITIKGSRENIEELVGNDYYYQECFWGSFSRSVILPCDVRSDEVEASMKNGVLTVKLPKAQKNVSTKIEVKGE